MQNVVRVGVYGLAILAAITLAVTRPGAEARVDLDTAATSCRDLKGAGVSRQRGEYVCTSRDGKELARWLVYPAELAN